MSYIPKNLPTRNDNAIAIENAIDRKRLYEDYIDLLTEFIISRLSLSNLRIFLMYPQYKQGKISVKDMHRVLERSSIRTIQLAIQKIDTLTKEFTAYFIKNKNLAIDEAADLMEFMGITKIVDKSLTPPKTDTLDPYYPPHPVDIVGKYYIKCLVCGKWKHYTKFYKVANNVYYRAKNCNSCESLQKQRKNKPKKKRKPKKPKLTKNIDIAGEYYMHCRACGAWKHYTKFSIAKSNRYNRRYMCVSCRLDKAKIRKERKNRIAITKVDVGGEYYVRCNKCNEWKHVTEFYQRKDSQYKCYYICKVCFRKSEKLRRERRKYEQYST